MSKEYLFPVVFVSGVAVLQLAGAVILGGEGGGVVVIKSNCPQGCCPISSRDINLGMGRMLSLSSRGNDPPPHRQELQPVYKILLEIRKLEVIKYPCKYNNIMN